MSNTLINADLSQAELRVMAVMSDDPWMISALQADSGDFFDNHFMPVAFPATFESYGSVEKWKLHDPTDHKEKRVQTKSVMYGLVFGRGAFAIGEEIGQPPLVAQRIIDSLFDRAPKFLEWRVMIERAATDPKYRDFLVNPFGRRYQREVITSDKQRSAVIREALSFLPQSTSSDICLATAIRINETLKENGYRIFNIVHDAIMVEGPEEDADTIGAYIVHELGQTGSMIMGDTVPFLAEYSTGQTWGDLD